MSVEAVLARFRTDDSLKKNVLAWRILPARPARCSDFPAGLSPDLREALRTMGIEALYLHQAEAVARALAGEDLVVSTPTASGKTLCYHLPVMQALLENPSATALYLFPTKALAQDQVAAFSRMSRELSGEIRIQAYDGDTPAEERKIIRASGRGLVTNPYMLHTGILPNHTRWVRFFQGLAYVVIDEVHTLTGVFGSHFANLMRRLRRLCEHYGSNPRFLLSSATLANPADLAEHLIGRPVATVDLDGSPKGEKHFIFYNPPLVNRELGIRRSGLEEARRLAELCLEARIQTLVFCRSRTAVEVMVKYLKDHLRRKGLDEDRVMGYRGGYLPLLRRRIEKGLREGSIDIVAATNALELGIDIGSLDACILAGYPGSVASTLQQAGRSGRQGAPSLALVVGRSMATDQYVIRHPGYVLDQAPEAGAVDPDNLVIRANQMKCAAFELPFREGEEFGGKGDTAEVLAYFEEEARILRKAKDRWFWASRTFPADKVNLQAGDMDNFVVFDREERRVIGTVDRPSAMSLIHPGAIYGLQGETYIIEELDYRNRRAAARKLESDYYTEAEVETEITVHHLDRLEKYEAFDVHLGEVGVTRTAPLYKKIRFYTRENLGTGPIDLPSESMHTQALMLKLHRTTAEAARLFEGARSAAFKAFGTLLHRVTPLYVRCDLQDLGVKTEILSKRFGQPTVILYDSVPGGVGLCETAASSIAPILKAMRRLIEGCGCKKGCPCCIDPPPDGEEEFKSGTLALLKALRIDAPPNRLEKAFQGEEFPCEGGG